MRIFAFIFLLITASLLITTSGCKVNYSFTGADIPAEAKTISVSYFIATATLANPQVSQQFTSDLIAMVLTQTSLDVVDEDGDLQYEGTITGYKISPAAVQSDTEAAAKNRLTMTVKVKYTNTIEPDKSFEKDFSQFADFNADENLNDVEELLIELIDEVLVQEIFNASLGSW
jgi:hypothetical protein